MTLERRRFLGLAAGALGGAALGVPAGRFLSEILTSAENPLYPPKGPETFALSVCAMCPGGCGLRVRRIGGRAVKLAGNPLHPVNAGRLCPRGQAALQGLNHPDRVPGPLRRKGPRGSLGSFERTTWDQTLSEIAARLGSLREQSRPESLVLVRGGDGGLGPRVARRFLEAFGSPNDTALDGSDEAAAIALFLTQGVRKAPAHDLQSSEYVLSLGSGLLESSSSPVFTMRTYGEFRQGRSGRRGKLVQVEPRLSLTGVSADEWIAVRPGTEGIFALGVAGVIVAEGLFDRSFVLDRTLGFDDAVHGRPSLRALLGERYGLEQVATETGISANVVLRVARELAAADSKLVVGPRRGPLLPGRPFDHLAAQVLNALVGSVDAPGGLLLPEEVPLAPWPSLSVDPVAEAGRAQPRLDGAGAPAARFPLLSSDPAHLAEAIQSGQPYPADVVLLVAGADPAYASAAPKRLAAALERVPMVISFATIADDSALRADWILPEAHFLERWDLHTSAPGVPFPVVSLSQPVVARPRHDTRPSTEVFLELAQRLGPEVKAALPWSDVPALIRAEMDGLYQAHRGAIVGTPFDEAWVRMMERAGWWAPGYGSTEELFERVKESGGWWDPFYDHGDWDRVIATESGRFELRTDLLGADRVAASPGLQRPRSEPAGFALHLFEPLAIAGGTGAELPFLQGLLDPGLEESWETWAEIHPESAARLGVDDRSWVRIGSPEGAIVARARVTSRVVPGVIALPVGLGKKGGGRWSRGTGASPLQLLVPSRDPITGLPEFHATRVEVTAVAGPAAAEREV